MAEAAAAVVVVAAAVVVAISRDKANCKWTSEKGIKLAARRLWQLDYTLIDCEPPFSTYELVAALCDAIAVTNPSEAHQGKKNRRQAQRDAARHANAFTLVLMERVKATEADRRYWKINSSLFVCNEPYFLLTSRASKLFI